MSDEPTEPTPVPGSSLTVEGFTITLGEGDAIAIMLEREDGSAADPFEVEPGTARLLRAMLLGTFRQARELDELRAAFQHEHDRAQVILSGWLEATSPVLAQEIAREIARAGGAPMPQPAAEPTPEEVARRAAEEHQPDEYTSALPPGLAGAELVQDPEPHRFFAAGRYGRDCGICGLTKTDPVHEVPDHPLEQG